MGILDSAKNLVDKAVAEAKELSEDLAEKAEQAAAQAKVMAGEALEDAKEFADQAGDKLSEVASAASVKADEGDVEFNTSASRADYSIDIQTENGDVTDSGNSELGPVYRMNGGQNMLKLRTVDGDIDLTFGDA